ncbi:hypothetical protein F5148DRAFT_1274479 [Russula earlei]|uniref:Uncharacterized protein n=1 Tax=Russula earlei TaxID=71964 RepID=A0ACC0UHJ6_9AGAM|nr:hypothetical protein F5148DRAFT_1274479 [Russula earlei]
MDLAEEIIGMYHLLELISESGSNGCVDKVVIAQDSLKRFINGMCPGSYASVTKVDFKALDLLTIKPLGVYGSKAEIVRFLRSLDAVNENMYTILCFPKISCSLSLLFVGSRPTLSSGLYMLEVGHADSIQKCHYVIYWPEDSTWDDSAPSSVCRNRVTFMRYLTKICDQVVALLSEEFSASLVWGNEDSDSDSVDMDPGDDDSRLFTYEVEKRNEQEESAVLRPGFQMNSRHISRYVAPAGCSVDPFAFVPSLIHGETAQGFWTASYVPPTTQTNSLDERSYTELSLKQLLWTWYSCYLRNENALVLSDSLDENAVRILVDVALSPIFPKQCEGWRAVTRDTREQFRQELIGKQETACKKLRFQEASLVSALRDAVVDDVIKIFPSKLERPKIGDFRRSIPKFGDIYRQHVGKAKFDVVKGANFKALKERLVFVRRLLKEHKELSPENRTELIQAILSDGDLRRAQQIFPQSDKHKEAGKGYLSVISDWWYSPRGTDEDSLRKEMTKMANAVSDSKFLQELKGIDDDDLAAITREALTVKNMTHAMLWAQEEGCKSSIRLEVEAKERKALSSGLVTFIRDINKSAVGRRNSVEPVEPRLKFLIHLMDLTSDDKHNMQSNPKHVPHPVVSDRRSVPFHLPLGLHIVYESNVIRFLVCRLKLFLSFHKLLAKEKFLLVLADRDKHRAKPIKTLNRDKVGEDLLFAYDETKRTLAVCASAKMQLHAFVFDETFRTLQGQGSVISLAPWYSQAGTSIQQMSSVCGSDEVVLVNSNAQIRIFSFVTQQLRPASLQLTSLPHGSCLLVVRSQDGKPSLTAYHWETFGTNDGISLEIPTFRLEGAVVTSIARRGCVFLLALDIGGQCVNSAAIDITKKVTEVVFQEKAYRNTSSSSARQTQHNSLLDCHKEVWTRFPVVPAVKRRTITSFSEREPKGLTFVCENPTKQFALYFSDLIQEFVRTIRKPTGDELRGIKVSATDFKSFREETPSNPNRNVSQYRLGEWLVDLLCLIPIHIAVCRENRFIPLANGVISSDLERSLLGADVNQIVDKLSFGWYESIFQSYMAKMPVKVVSSMGQQSVGKSFSLNHLVDTSFAGSAMRTTEGVWMSVTPTDEELIVALDFEGVDTVERSPQEDTLLVLFNTAISNLVLFRNNFALGRDISGLFQSFQSSASVLDPAANPSLFQSTLVIIIKVSVTCRFSSKFQKIVEQEQDANFISRLHGGKLNIIPWPVIESKEFYKLFTTLKKRLDQQKVSHPTAGEFLHTIKILMAKIKANDWGALSQTMAEHRAKSLSALLLNALTTGFSEIEPELEPLKDLNTDVILPSNDTTAIFAIFEGEQVQPVDIERHLAALLNPRRPSVPRQHIPDSEWIAELKSYLDELVDLRVNHVRTWLDCNLGRFQGGNAAIEDLRRRFGHMVIEMKTNVQLCGAQCASCLLLCVRSRLHEGDHSCNTTHKCVHNCDFCEDDVKICGTSAGHPGKHVCAVTAHLCGEPCKLSGRRGCLEDCTKVPRHADDDHMCSALVHMCGEDHKTHSCDTRLCPSTCELCKRLCDESHLHGLTSGAHHLCGEAHTCSALCSEKGICQIETAPQSIQATFTGRHETFQYTKRLQCVMTIPPGKTSHEGSHIHSKEDRPFHFCEARCENCSYFCTLPLGHAQQEHETSHGSMTQTRWAVDGPDGTSLELGGRKFSSNDEGAPMMCNLICSSIGRHVHIDYCRTEQGGRCDGAEVQHLNARMTPNPDRLKDAVTHGLYWRRMGPEHSGTPAGTGKPSYCTLPISASMASTDRQPLANAPMTHRIQQSANNRLGAVYSSLYSFWSARHVATMAGRQTAGARRDAYSLILFNEKATNILTNDFTSSPDQLLGIVLSSRASGGTRFLEALRAGQAVMEQNWSTERTPIMIFLSDGECAVPDSAIQDVCRSAVRLGKPLSFHSISFGPDTSSAYLRKMATLALGIQNNAPRDPLMPQAGSIPSSYSIALDTVRLAETFLGIAESLRKPRGSLMC